ncbi:hypothetical protein Pmar_PMAR009510 [Perkinsus marinus ATCC 50983]|uniref:Chromo domain-containing protein n=1 Tax=Perkinsus marinus (strain ATCC 50983 / TXsc) TaxID=423536 RepID=C5KED8_PERM5|nr:hypothetical protein Pmar_PMAR009510 [Perkinsus marinus ATCC 50983]EER17076.1 hypothetical protein Pmar_PMAR009510 [Perkinsus marinus ATCC 50983]|eukprot:XP_002785280.1 hypothetical protein Pmar_PMAR009510 [Perkinsus marinus ATCC 50983]
MEYVVFSGGMQGVRSAKSGSSVAFTMILRERRKASSSLAASTSEEEYRIGVDALEQLDKALATLEEEEEEEQPSREIRPRRARENNKTRIVDPSSSSDVTPSPSPSSSPSEDEDSTDGPDLEGGIIVARTRKDGELWLLVKPRDEAWNKVLWAPFEVCCEEDAAFRQRYANFKRKYRESEGPHAVDFVANRRDRSSSSVSGDGGISRSGRATSSLSGAAVIDMPQKELLDVLVDRGVINAEWLVPDHLLTCSKVDDGKIWLVQWGGLPVSEATWEDESPTDTPQELIDEWNKWNDASRKLRWQKIADEYLAAHKEEIEEIAAAKRVKKRGRPPKHKKRVEGIAIQDIRRPKVKGLRRDGVNL